MLKNYIILTVVCFLFAFPVLKAEECSIPIFFGKPKLNYSSIKPIQVEGAFNYYSIDDLPMLPYYLAVFSLPEDVLINSVTVKNSDSNTMVIDSLESKGQYRHFNGDPVPYPPKEDNFIWPKEKIEWSVHGGIDPKTLQRRRFVILRLFPVQLMENKRLLYSTYINVSINFKRIDTPFSSLLDIDQIHPFLIITSEGMTSSLNPYIVHKTNSGLVPEVVTIETILQESSGFDDAEKMRNYIRSQVEQSGTSFVLLAGDADILPVRRSFQETDPLGIQTLPMETYFSDLYNGNLQMIDWDADEDNNFGSYPDDLPEMDFIPDVFLSRIPASTNEELSIALNSIIEYETNTLPDSDWFNRVIFAAVDIFDDNTGIPEGEMFAEQLASNIFNNLDVVRLYQTDTYLHDGPVTPEYVVEKLSEGAGFMAFHCHGGPDCFYIEGGCFTHEHAAATLNGYRRPVLFGFACSTAAFDNELPDWPYSSEKESMPEHLLLNQTGGAIAYVGATRIALASGYAHAEFRTGTGAIEYPYFQAWLDGADTPAMMLSKAECSFIKHIGYQSYYDYLTISEYTQFGDPTLAIGGLPSRPHLTVTAYKILSEQENSCTLPGSTSDLFLAIMNSGVVSSNPSLILECDDPNVTLPVSTLNLGEIGRYETIHLSDSILICADPEPSTPRQVVIKAKFFSDSQSVGESDIPCFIGSGASINLTDWDIAFDSSYNANIDPGDKIYPAFFLRNIGCETAFNLTIDATTDSDWLDWCKVHANGAIGNLPSGWGMESKYGVIDIGIREDCPHGTIIPLDITVTGDPGVETHWTVNLEVLDHIGPKASDTILSDRSPLPGQYVHIQTNIYDISGVESVKCEIRAFPTGMIEEIQLFDDGLHGDGFSEDGIYGNDFQTPGVAGDFILKIISIDLRGNVSVLEEASAFSTKPIIPGSFLIISSSPDFEAMHKIRDSLQKLSLPTSEWDIRFRGSPSISVLEKFSSSAVIWTFGWGQFPNAEERSIIKSYIESGGGLILCGWDVARYVNRTGGRSWLESTLKVGYSGPNTGKYRIQGVPGDSVFDGLNIRLLKYRENVELKADMIEQTEAGETRMLFSDGHNPAVVTFRDIGVKTAFLPFALEHIKYDEDRIAFFNRIIPWISDHPERLKVDLYLNQNFFKPGDLFQLEETIVNPYPYELTVRNMIALYFNSVAWFWPSWSQYPPDIDYEDVELDSFSKLNQIILSFQWPEINMSGSDLVFYGVLLDPATHSILTSVSQVEFSFGY